MTITRNFKLCLNAGTQNAPYINVNQYDEGEEWVFDLYTEGGQKFTPSTGAIIGIKSDGNAILNSGTVNSDGQVVITETQQMTAASGLAVFELLIEGETHGTANFIVNVERRPSDDAEISDSDLSLIQEAVDAASEIEDLLDGQDVPTVITPIITDWLDENITNPSNPPIDTSLTVAGAAADAKVTGDEITDLKSAFNTLTLKTQSSVVSASSYTTMPDGKRFRLNSTPIQPNIILGDLYMVANDILLNGTITIELATFSNGSYTVYESKTVTMSGDAVKGDLIKAASIGVTTSNETYVFVTTSNASRFRGASVTGGIMVVSDDISSESFTTRIVNNYELMFLIEYAATEEYLNTLTDGLKTLLVDVEIPDSVLFKNVGYYFNNVTAEMESAGNNVWIVSDYIPVGDGITVTGSAYSAYRPQIVEYDSTYNIIGQQKLGAIGSVTKTYTSDDGVAFVRLQSTINTGNIASGTQKMYEPVPKVYRVEKDGTGDYTNLADAIAEATRRMDAVVYVGAGTWNILDELGDDYLANLSTTKQGIVLKNRVHVICSSKAYIKCLYNGSDADVIDHISAFNAGPYGFTLENADIEVANVRYCIHDERNAETEHYDNYYINCRMKNTNSVAGSRSQCIGGGLGYDGHVIIDGCTFENPLRENYGIVSYHNAHGLATDSRSLIEVKGCYFYGTNTFRAGYYGNTTAMTQCLVHGNSMGAAPFVTQEDPNFSNVNMEIIAWQNDIR